MKHKTLVGLLVLFVLLRLAGFSHTHTEDAHTWVLAALADDPYSELVTIPHPPLTVVWYLIAGLTGSVLALHLVPLFFQIMSAILIYFLVNKWHGKRAAELAVALLAVCVWFITPASQLDTDGSILLCYVLFAIWFYEQSWEKPSWRTFSLLALALAAVVLVKFTGFLLGVVFLISDWYRSKNVKTFAPRMVTYAASAAVFLLAMFLVKIWHPAYVGAMFSHGGNFIGNPLEQNLLNVFSIFAQAVILISPLLWALLFVWFRSKPKRNTGDILCWTFLITWFVFHLFILNASFRPLERYLLPSIFAFVALGASALVRLKWKPTKTFVLGTIWATLLFIVFELLTTRIYPIYPKAAYFTRIFSLDWDFLFPFRGSSGPFGFYISFLTIGLGFLVVGLLVLTWLKYPKPAILIAILAVGLAYNVVLAEEYMFTNIHPDINPAGHAIVAYAAGKDLPPPVLAWNRLGASELKDIHDVVHFGFAFDDDPITVEKLQNAGSILFLDYGKLGEETETWKTIHGCQQTVVVRDKNVYLGGVFICQPRTS